MKLLFCGLMLVSAAWGQLATSSIVGSVTDPTGLGVPGVSIRAVRADTGHTRETAPDARGDFVLSNLEAGT